MKVKKAGNVERESPATFHLSRLHDCISRAPLSSGKRKRWQTLVRVIGRRRLGALQQGLQMDGSCLSPRHSAYPGGADMWCWSCGGAGAEGFRGNASGAAKKKVLVKFRFPIDRVTDTKRGCLI